MAEDPRYESAEALSPEEARALRTAAAVERASGSAELALVLDDLAEHGLPAVADCVPWETVRDEHYRKLGILIDGPRVA